MLPDDVLYLILEQACVLKAKPFSPPWKHSSIFDGSSMFSSFTARILSGVCRRWRSLLLSNPIVWSDVHITIRRPENLLWLDTCLTRSTSSSAGRAIHIDQPNGILPRPDIIDAIFRHLPNIRYLQINPRSREDYDFLAVKMESLERLHIECGTFSRKPIPSASHSPNLRVVILRRLPAVSPDALTNLTDLTLHSITSPMTNLVDTLQVNQTLENVRFIWTLVEADPRGRLVSLPNLKLLCISHSSPDAILHTLSPLPTPSRVIVHDDTISLATTIRPLFYPFLVFGPKDSVRTVSISFLPEEASIKLHTSNDATVQIIIQAAPTVGGGGTPAEFSSLLRDVSGWGPFPHLRSMDLHITPAAMGPIHNATIYSLLSRAPRMTRLSFSGSTLLRHIVQALNSTPTPEIICSELEFLGGTLRHDDAVVEDLRSLSNAIKRNPTTIRKIALDVPGSEEEIAGILEEAGSLIQEIKSHGVHELLLTRATVQDYPDEPFLF